MEAILILIVLSVIFLSLFAYHVHSIQFSVRKLPPGPPMAPFKLGIIPHAIWASPGMIRHLVNLQPWKYLHTLYKQYGEIYTVSAGGFYVVVVSSYEIMTELANMDEYSKKFAHPDLTYNRTFNKELGLIFAATTELWVEMRKFTQRTLRDFGFGKRHTMQSAIEAETTALIKEFNNVIQKDGGVIKVRTTFVLSVLNVLWCMVAGTRYEHDDPKLVQMMERNFEMTKSITFAEPLHVIFSIVKKYFPWIFKEDLRLKVFSECHQFSKSLIDERREEGSWKTNPQNYIDVFLSKIEENKDKESVYTEEQLMAMLADLLQTGSTTTNGTLNYAMLYLMLNPDMQKKCQQEIDANVPRHLAPTLEDIEKMHYFQAFILETHRLANIVPNPIPRLAPKDWKFRNYFIPKDTVIFSNHYSVHMDEKNFPEPHLFKPERFLNEKGEFFLDKRVIHFGFGKRICIGITLANSVIPIFISTLLQHFNFSVVPGTMPPTTEPETGVSLSPMEYPMYITNR